MNNFHKASTLIINGSQEHKLIKLVLHAVHKVLIFLWLDKNRVEQLKSILLFNLKFGIKIGSVQVSESNPSLNVFYSDCVITYCVLAQRYSYTNSRKIKIAHVNCCLDFVCNNSQDKTFFVNQSSLRKAQGLFKKVIKDKQD